MRIGTNVVAQKGLNNLNKVNELKSKSLEKLTTGKRINSASDDASGLSISTKLDSQIRGLKVASKNIADGQSMLETAEGALGEMTEILQRARELATTAANDTNSAEERSKITTELAALTEEIDKIAGETNFNGVSLLGGATVKLQVGANSGDSLEVTFATATADALGLDAPDDIDVSDHDAAGAYLETIDAALATVSDKRAELGSTINRLSYSQSNINTSIENLSAANSRIVDVDMADEMSSFTKNNILSQAGTNMLAQSMQMPNSVLSLLG